VHTRSRIKIEGYYEGMISIGERWEIMGEEDYKA
jgi:hypothetical protein